MSNLLFNTYSVKGNLKFYKVNCESEDNEEKITVSIGISANHQIKENIYEDLSAFLEKLLIEDYMNEQTYQSRKEHEKAIVKAVKEQGKREKLQEKQRKAKSTKVVKKKSIY